MVWRDPLTTSYFKWWSPMGARPAIKDDVKAFWAEFATYVKDYETMPTNIPSG